LCLQSAIDIGQLPIRTSDWKEVRPMDIVGYYEDLIKNQRREIRGWWLWVILVALGGASMTIYGLVSPSGPTPDLYKTLAGAFLTAFASFPYKNIPPRRERIVTYCLLMQFFKSREISQEEEHQLFMDLAKESGKVTVQRGPNG
jgi:hypothetical protein